MNTATNPLAKAGVFIGSMAIGLTLATGFTTKADAAPAPAAKTTGKATAHRTAANDTRDRSFAWATARSKKVCGATAKRSARGVASMHGRNHAHANRASTALAKKRARVNARRAANAVATSKGFKRKHCASRSSIVGKAAALKGRPYRWGATGPGSFDCSGYVGYVYRKAAGKNLPRTSGAIAASGRRVSSPRPGDIAVFHSGGRVYHVGIYAGSGKMWHSPKPGASVRKESMWGGRYFVRY